MNKYKVWVYDVWGNAHDGFEVNNRFSTSIFIEVDPDDDAQIIRELKSAGIIKKGCRFSSFDIDGEPDYTMYVNQVNAAVGGLYPICELERESNADSN